jgi:uncharacterized membrane protein YqgA involved in biofilm formation
MIKELKESFIYLFNWKKYPASVFYFALPLFVFGMTLCGFRAYLEWIYNHDIVYTFIMLGGIGLLIMGLWPIRKFIWKMLS